MRSTSTRGYSFTAPPCLKFKIKLKSFTQKLHEVIGDHNTAIVNIGDTINSADMYADCLYYDNKEDETTYSWDDNWEDLPLSDKTETTQKDLDEYINAQVFLISINT